MTIKEILAKVVAGEALTDEEKSTLESYEEPNLDAAANAKGKKERLKHEKKIAELQAALDEKETEIETVSAGSSEMEKIQKLMEKTAKKAEALEAQLQTEQKAHAETLRSNALKSLTVDWLPSVSGKYRDTVMQEAFADIDTSDLMDKAVVAPILKGLVESQASFIAATTPSGAGTSGKEKANVSDNNKITHENVGSLRGKDLVDNLDAAWAAASSKEK